MPDDDFGKRVKQQILDAYGYASEAELDARADEAAYLAALPERMREVAAMVTVHLRASGMLPDGVELEVVPMDLQADPLWMAEAPWCRRES